MKSQFHIRKLAHCSFLINYKDRVIMTDPGYFCAPEMLDTHVDILFISHVHADHFMEDNVKTLLQKNPSLKIIGPEEVIGAADEAVAEAGDAQAFAISDGQILEIDEISFRGIGKWHAEIYENIGKVENAGVIIDERVFFAGDAYEDVKMPEGEKLDLVMFCIDGPFAKLSDAINWVKGIAPVRAVPMHESVITEGLADFEMSVAAQAFQGHETIFIPLVMGGEVVV